MRSPHMFLIPDITQRQKDRRRDRNGKLRKRDKATKVYTLSRRSFFNGEVKLTQQLLWPPHSCVLEKRTLPSQPPPDGPVHRRGNWSPMSVEGGRVGVWFHTKRTTTRRKYSNYQLPAKQLTPNVHQTWLQVHHCCQRPSAAILVSV